jgi:hypothetical protein
MKSSTKHQGTQSHQRVAEIRPPLPDLARETERRTPRSSLASALLILSKLLARQAAAEFLLSVASPTAPALAAS